MSRHNTNEVFYIMGSKFKIWAFTIVCWFFAFLFFLLFVLMLKHGFDSGNLLSVDSLFALLVLFILFLPFAIGPIPALVWLKKPVAILTPQGFSGTKMFREKSFPWSPETIIFTFKGNLLLANPDSAQSLMSKLWCGPKNVVMVDVFLSKQKRRDILKSIDRLSPYKIKDGGLFGIK